jgi:hypothetical protein
MDDLIIFKEKNFGKVADTEKGRKIIEKLKILQNAFEKLSSNDRKTFTDQFKNQFQSSTEKLKSAVNESDIQDETENSYELFHFFMLIATVLMGKCNELAEKVN